MDGRPSKRTWARKRFLTRAISLRRTGSSSTRWDSNCSERAGGWAPPPDRRPPVCTGRLDLRAGGRRGVYAGDGAERWCASAAPGSCGLRSDSTDTVSSFSRRSTCGRVKSWLDEAAPLAASLARMQGASASTVGWLPDGLPSSAGRSAAEWRTLPPPRPGLATPSPFSRPSNAEHRSARFLWVVFRTV